MVQEGLRAGARGYLLKSDASRELNATGSEPTGSLARGVPYTRVTASCHDVPPKVKDNSVWVRLQTNLGMVL